ncbi:LysM peptidoglycan-binding domain-containing protein [Effusibacillus lacus]|uniref:LysM domain-containing protein n=1 Tax=Effusibacillus lacus TaxID=1348429 RepID=A0A292YTG3_9BACL|nr:LysM peptidoglycan-binding domain-containing protein [Effusibacillus lacus]TCS75837.1 LysM domain-containing protein [Effusibacillus lacus]GAX91770.1 hypothetical protein EFBL_3461 [Effusibacillus lacus]
MKTIHFKRIKQKVKGVAILGSAVFFLVLSTSFLGGNEVYGSHETAVVVVQPGDTLWSIAKTHYPGKDVHEAIHHIKKSNGLSSAKLQIGTELRLSAF